MSGSALFKTSRYVAEVQTTDGSTLTSFAAVTPEAGATGFTLKCVGFRWEIIGSTAAGNAARWVFEGVVAPIGGSPVIYGLTAISAVGLAALLAAVPTIAISYAGSRITMTPKVTGVAANTINWVSWLQCTVH